MELSFIFIQALLSIFLTFTTSPASTESINTNVTDFSCSASSCKTYIIYRTQSPEFLDLGNISDLFDISRLSIMKANNLPSEDVVFLPDQLVYVPISCGCTGNRSFANVTYEIQSGDSFYLLSISKFENLTDYHVTKDLNPTLEPTKLRPGQLVVFPVYCKCPTQAQLYQGFNFLVTYAWQPGDDISALSKKMKTSSEALLDANNYRNLSAAIDLPILIPISTPPKFPSPLYYNATSSTSKQSPRSNTALIITTSLLGCILVLVLLSFFLIKYWKQYPEKCFINMTSSLDTAEFLQSKNTSSASDQNLSPRVCKLLTGLTEYIDRPVVFDTTAIMEATMNLDQRFRLGTSVYRATIEGEVFAVKQGKGDITEEVNILQKVNHANLVKLAGVSTETDGFCFLVYEFAENGSLDKWLYAKNPSSSSAFLSWKQRLSVALDVAFGLQYMHEHTRPSIVHRDIRSGNILLTANFKAKISNFSIAKPVSISTMPMTDVYGFGIVLLELLSGRRAMTTLESGKVSMLWKEIRMVLDVEEKAEERLRQWMDSSLGELYHIEAAMSLAAMAKACTSEVASERPSMSEIVFSLSVLAHSCSNEFEESHNSHSQETIQIITPVVAR